jgi:hypothetical protein
MPRGALRIGAEFVIVLAVLASVAGALGLVVAMHRRQVAELRAAAAAAVVVIPPAPKAAPEPPRPAPAPAPVPVEDPTPRELARLAAIEQDERREAAEATRRAAESEQALREARARIDDERDRRRRIDAQVAGLEDQARVIAGHLDTLARQRDVLARMRDDARQELAQARSKDGLAVLPYKGPNGTWRRPIPIECRDGTATIQPGGPTFRLLELSALGMFRSHPLVAAVSRYLAHAEMGRSPDGAPVVPYILFIVRPDGIRPYYEARGILEPLGIAFGYELVEQDVELEYPDLDDPVEWSEAPPLRFARQGWPPAPGDIPAGGDDPFLWPATPPGGGGGSGDDLLLPPASLAGEGTTLTEDGPGGPMADAAPSSGMGGPEPYPSGTGAEGPRPAPSPLAGIRPGSDGADSPSPTITTPRRGTVASGSGHPGGSFGPGDPRSQDATPPGQWGREPSGLAAAGRPAGRELGERTARSIAGVEGLGLADASAPGAAGAGGTPGRGGAGGASGSVDGSTFRMERPMELVVACGPQGVTIQPGGYRLTLPNLEPSDAKLVEMLRGLVRRHEAREPSRVLLKPRLTFLVEPGGQQTYWKARQQTVLAGLGWPVRLRVAEGSVASGIGPGGWLR